MQDIRGDLQERADLLKEQIHTEQAQFDDLVKQLQAEQQNSLQAMRAELLAINRLIELVTWQSRLRAATAGAIESLAAADSSDQNGSAMGSSPETAASIGTTNC